ncbi:MAG: DNA-processing protein DprA [Bacteroidales bacterium]|nr:DNA-processing protein DprA [Bacteroidales bacterium]
MLLHKIALTLIPKIGDKTARKLLSIYPDVSDIFLAKPKDLIAAGFSRAAIQSITKSDVMRMAEEELKFIEKNEIKTLFYADENYPYRLRFCDDAPVLLYYKGNINFDHPKILSVVGTRMATEYGKNICRRIIEEMSLSVDLMIVSGLAHGIDTQAHTVALDNNVPTIGVVAHGHDILYPRLNTKLAANMLHNGAIITEFRSKTIPDRENFPKRNRIIAGLSDAVLVIEAARKGGALITAEIANSYGREVFAVPGKIGDAYSEGCNNLISANKAMLVQSADDILTSMNWKPQKNRNKQLKLFVDLSEEESKLMIFIQKNEVVDIDTIIYKNELSPTHAATLLLSLELKNLIQCMPGKRYSIS